jgi:hypothetical protein
MCFIPIMSFGERVLGGVLRLLHDHYPDVYDLHRPTPNADFTWKVMECVLSKHEGVDRAYALLIAETVRSNCGQLICWNYLELYDVAGDDASLKLRFLYYVIDHPTRACRYEGSALEQPLLYGSQPE